MAGRAHRRGVPSRRRARSCGSIRRARTPRWTGCCAERPQRPARRDRRRTRLGTRGFAAPAAEVAAGSRRRRAAHLTQPTPRHSHHDRQARAATPRCAAAGIPVPPALLGPVDWVTSRCARRWTSAGWRRVFVKPAHGVRRACRASIALRSAAARPACERGHDRQSRAVRAGGSSTTLRVRRYDDEADDRRDRRPARARTACTSSAGYPKAALGDRVVDLRVVVIAGRAQPTSWSAPAGRPMTNLHLGNARGDLAAVRAAAGDGAWAAAMRDLRAGGRVLPAQPCTSVST